MKMKALLLVGLFTLTLCSCGGSGAKMFTVTFETNGGSSISSQTIEEGRLATRPTNPTKNELIFINWYENDALSEVFFFGRPITSNVTLYAKWSEEKVGECSYQLDSDQESYCVSGVIDRTCTSYNILPVYNSLPVTSIFPGAFSLCSSLTSITIPNSVTTIDKQAFSSCHALTSISYSGTKAQWNSVYKGAEWSIDVPATKVHCSDGDVALNS